METNSKKEGIYDASAAERRSHTGSGIVVFAIGSVVLFYYVMGIKDGIAADVRNFPAAFDSDPTLTIIFILLKICAYIIVPIFCGIAIYCPIRDIFAPRVVSGRFNGMTTISGRGGKTSLVVSLGSHKVKVRDSALLRSVLIQDSLLHQELSIVVGSFGRVLTVKENDRATE
ncbi:MAG TPA: hypothetical protein VFK06_00220 [Candidatus Angelobacter sp.]|nr:hypothetical protein [Candidatus Angelobacter sp.]